MLKCSHEFRSIARWLSIFPVGFGSNCSHSRADSFEEMEYTFGLLGFGNDLGRICILKAIQSRH